MRATSCLSALLILALALPARANVYRCEEDGRLSFSDHACAAGQAPLEVAPANTLETTAGQAALAQQYDARTASLHEARLDAELTPPSVPAEKVSRKKPRAARGSRGSTKRPKAPRKPPRPPELTQPSQQGLRR